MSPSISMSVAAAVVVVSVALPWHPPAPPTPSAQSAQTTQAPVIQNGRVETRQVSSLERDLPPLGGPDPVWAFWRVPMLDGERGPCSTSQVRQPTT